MPHLASMAIPRADRPRSYAGSRKLFVGSNGYVPYPGTGAECRMTSEASEDFHIVTNRDSIHIVTIICLDPYIP